MLFWDKSLGRAGSIKNKSVLMKSGREGRSPVICSTIPDKRSLVIQNH